MSDMNVTIYDIAKNAMFPSLLYRVSSMATAGSAKNAPYGTGYHERHGLYAKPVCPWSRTGFHENRRCSLHQPDRCIFASAVSLIEDGMRQHHFDIMLSCTGPDTGHNSPYITSLVNKHVDGLITVGTVFPPNRISQFLQRLQKSRFLQSTVITICPVSIVSSVMKQKACGGSYTPCPDSTAGPSLTCITSGHTAAATNCKGCARG